MQRTEPSKKRLKVKKERLQTLTPSDLGAIHGGRTAMVDTKCCRPH